MSVDRTEVVNLIQQVLDDSDLAVRVRQLQGIDAVRAPVLGNGWTQETGEEVGFYRDRRRVWLRGQLKAGALGVAAFTLPTGYRPEHRSLHAVRGHNGTTEVAAFVYVEVNGDVIPGGPSNVRVHLDGISARLP